MPEWVLGGIVTGIFGSIAAAAILFWGERFSKIFRTMVLRMGQDIHIEAESNYKQVLSETITTLKDRLAVLERWREEALILEKRVEDLEVLLRQLQGEKEQREQEYLKVQQDLTISKQELLSRERAILALERELDVEKAMVVTLREQVDFNKARIDDNQTKIAALLHQAENGKDS